MKINASLLFRDDFKKQYVSFPFNENGNADILFENLSGKYQTRQEKNIKDHSAEIKTINTGCVDIIFELEFFFESDEKILATPNHFPQLSYKSFTPLLIHVATNKRQLVFSSSKSYQYKFVVDAANKKLSIQFIIDAPFLHPSWDYQLKQRRSTAFPLQPGETQYHFNFKMMEMAANIAFQPIQQYTYPFAQKAAFILTDHCDFDDEEKLTAFLYGDNDDGWLNKELKISKGVFTLGPKEGEPKKNSSLEDEGYKKLIGILFKDGSEIIPHALKSKGQLSTDEYNSALQKLHDQFHSRTWIDHGSYLKYCYSQGAKENPDYLLVDTLKKYGYNNLWSFHDVNLEANDTLDIFTSKQVFPFKVLFLSIKYFFTGKWLVSAHYLRSIIHRNYSKNVIVEYLMFAMAGTKGIFINWKNRKHTLLKDIRNYFKSLVTFSSHKNNLPVPYKSDDVLKFCAPLYLEDRRPIAQYTKGDLLMFSTFETTHLVDIYNKKALDKLIAANGTHIGHTYILNDLPYINSIFKKKNGQYFLAEKWKFFLKVLSEYVKAKKIWNPNMSEYADYIIALQSVSLQYISEREIEITNDSDRIIEGYTFVTPAKFKAELQINNITVHASETDSNYHFFILDIPNDKKTFVSFL